MDARICFFGDSFTTGVGDEDGLGWVGRVVARARADGLELTAYNLGVRQQTGPEIAARLEAEAALRLRDGDAFGVVLAAGVNDTKIDKETQRVQVEGSLAALDVVIDLCATRGWALLVVGPAPVADRSQNERIVSLSAALAAQCSFREIPFVGVAPLLASDDAWLDQVASVDGSHPRGSGYQTLADLLQPAFSDWLRSMTFSR